jgi:hypothetical protein
MNVGKFPGFICVLFKNGLWEDRYWKKLNSWVLSEKLSWFDLNLMNIFEYVSLKNQNEYSDRKRKRGIAIILFIWYLIIDYWLWIIWNMRAKTKYQSKFCSWFLLSKQVDCSNWRFDFWSLLFLVFGLHLSLVPRGIFISLFVFLMFLRGKQRLWVWARRLK